MFQDLLYIHMYNKYKQKYVLFVILKIWYTEWVIDE